VSFFRGVFHNGSTLPRSVEEQIIALKTGARNIIQGAIMLDYVSMPH
jgi:hypothetical protein